MVRCATHCHKSVSELLVVGWIFEYRHTIVRQFLMILFDEDTNNALMIVRTWCVTCVEQTEQLGHICTVSSRIMSGLITVAV